MLSSASPTESSRIQALQQSLSVHEVAIASLRGEYQRQSGELKLAEEEVSRLRKSLAKKVGTFLCIPIMVFVHLLNSIYIILVLSYYMRYSSVQLQTVHF